MYGGTGLAPLTHRLPAESPATAAKLPAATGADTSRQTTPSQCMISGFGALSSSTVPTAHAFVAERAHTLSSRALGTVGSVATRQADPVRCTIIGSG
jgi:hypothetical protein